MLRPMPCKGWAQRLLVNFGSGRGFPLSLPPLQGMVKNCMCPYDDASDVSLQVCPGVWVGEYETHSHQL